MTMKLLIIEDEASLQELMTSALKKDGYIVENAMDYAEAMDKLGGYSYDCILLDINLPGGNGLDILRHIKKSGSKELFDKQKLLAGVLKATEKRPVDAVLLVNEIEAELQNTLRQEITSTDLGEIVMRKLRERDEVAYVRFASVYREFKDIDTFLEELKVLKERAEANE